MNRWLWESLPVGNSKNPPSSSQQAAPLPAGGESRAPLASPAGAVHGSACLRARLCAPCIHQPINLLAGLLPNFRTFPEGRVKMQLLRQMPQRAARRG